MTTKLQQMMTEGKLRTVCTKAIAMDRLSCDEFESICFSSMVKFLAHDWGNVDEEDAEANNEAIEDGGMVLGSYNLPATARPNGDDDKIWIIADGEDPYGSRTVTILYPSEY